MADDAAITVEEDTRTFRRTRTPLLKQIQEALTEAAASHQEAVLTMIQNYENLPERRSSASSGQVWQGLV